MLPRSQLNRKTKPHNKRLDKGWLPQWLFEEEEEELLREQGEEEATIELMLLPMSRHRLENLRPS